MPATNDTDRACHLYDGDAADLMTADDFQDRVSLLPGEPARPGGRRLRLLWGQDMLHDVVEGRYRAIVCGVNDVDNSHGIIAQLVNRVTTSQWSERSVTSYARMFQESVSVHAAHDREPYVLKFDLDSMLVLALLRPKGRDAFTLADLGRGFKTIAKMLTGRADRRPVCSVSFLGARSNRLVMTESDETEPSFETVLRTMHEAGFTGDVYPSPAMWSQGHTGIFPTYPFPAGLHRMREGSS